MDEKAYALVRRGQQASAVGPFLTEEIDRQERKVIAGVLHKLNSGEVLDPQFAVQEWIRIAALRQVLIALSKTEKAGQSAGNRLKPDMEIK